MDRSDALSWMMFRNTPGPSSICWDLWRQKTVVGFVSVTDSRSSLQVINISNKEINLVTLCCNKIEYYYIYIYIVQWQVGWRWRRCFGKKQKYLEWAKINHGKVLYWYSRRTGIRIGSVVRCARTCQQRHTHCWWSWSIMSTANIELWGTDELEPGANDNSKAK